MPLVSNAGPYGLDENDQDRVTRAQREFNPETTYLNTASIGLPPRRSMDALQDAMSRWEAGMAQPGEYDSPLEEARSAYAKLIKVEPSLVAVGSQVSVFVGLIAANLPPGAEVLTASGDFTSVLFPLLAQQERGVVVREVPLEKLSEAVREQTTLVAVSAVQSADGSVADLDALHKACQATSTRTLIDLTQAAGWLAVDASRFSYTVAGGYKWLLAPRGTAYLSIQQELQDELIAHHAGWYAGPDVSDTMYGTPLRLASDARRFDISPVWHAWVGAAPSLELLSEVGIETLQKYSTDLANAFLAGVGLARGNSSIISLKADSQVSDLMKAAKVVGSNRAGRLRLSFHISNTEDDVQKAVEVLAGHLSA